MTANSPSPQAVSLAPCPFCGGEAEIIHLDDGDNAGGSCVCCTSCQASGNVEFGRKENFVENWNRRAADGVVVPRGEVTDEWADRFCAAINWSPEGQECKVVEGEMRCATFRQIAKGHILAAIATGPDAASPALSASEGGETWSSMAKWTEETFGPVSLERIATRANEEMLELLADPSDVMEAADVCIVLSRYPGLEDAINRKMAINRKREWRLNGDGSGYHVKTLAASPALAATSGGGLDREVVAAIIDPDAFSLDAQWDAALSKADAILALSPPPADADKLLIAREALEPFADAARGFLDATGDEWDDLGETPLTLGDLRRAAEALARLSTTEASATPADAVEGESK